jgi:hypothetical protein
MGKSKVDISDAELLADEEEGSSWETQEENVEIEEITKEDDPQNEVDQDSMAGEDEFNEDIEEVEEVEEEEEKEEDVGEEDEQEDEQEDDTEDFSKAVQKRIGRERKLKREAEERALEAKDQIYKAEYGAWEARSVAFEAMAKENKRDIKDAIEKLKRAKEDDETDDEIEAMNEINELQSKGRELTRSQESNKKPSQDEKHSAGTPQTQKWVDRNRWFSDPSNFRSEIGYARVIDSEMGSEPNWKNKIGTSEYFAELDTRIHSRMSDLRIRIKKAYGNKSKPRVASVPRDTVVSKKRAKGVIRMTKEQRANAEQFGLKTKAEIEAYVAEQTKRERLEAKGGR